MNILLISIVWRPRTSSIWKIMRRSCLRIESAAVKYALPYVEIYEMDCSQFLHLQYSLLWVHCLRFLHLLRGQFWRHNNCNRSSGHRHRHVRQFPMDCTIHRGLPQSSSCGGLYDQERRVSLTKGLLLIFVEFAGSIAGTFISWFVRGKLPLPFQESLRIEDTALVFGR